MVTVRLIGHAQSDHHERSKLFEICPADHLVIASTTTHQQGGADLHQVLDCLHGFKHLQ